MSYKLYDAEIEYLEGTGTQWINTGIKPNGDTIVKADINISGAYAYLFGARNDTSAACYMVSNNGGSNKAVFRYNTSQGTGLAANAITGRCNLEVRGNVLYVNGTSTVSRTAATFTTNYPLYIFAYNGAGSLVGWNIASYKLYSFKIDNGEEKRDFIPVRVGNTGYLFDKVSGELFGNSGTGSFVLGSDVAPAAYANEVAFLESTGSQYIDTGIKPDNTYTFDTKIAALQDNYNCVYWGVRSAGTSADYNKQCFCNSNTTSSGGDWAKAISLYSTRAMSGEGNWTSGIVPTLRTMYSLTNMTVVSTMETMTYPITLFAFNVEGTVNASAGVCRIYSFVAYSNGVKVCDMIPVEYNNIGYMYDKVSGQFFANQGTGKFVLGHRAPRFDGKACARSYTRRQLMPDAQQLSSQKQYLTFKAEEDGTFTFSNAAYYSLDRGLTWKSLAASTATPTIKRGTPIMWRASITPASSTGVGTFTATGNFKAKGNPLSLMYSGNFTGKALKQYCFYMLFKGNTKLVDSSGMWLGTTSTAQACYYQMFYGCSNMTRTVSLLPATNGTGSCYKQMFYGCSNLLASPTISLTSVGSECCNGMFQNCTSMTQTTPTLLAMTLSGGQCYRSMYQGCTSLITAPEIKATSISANDVCYSMFNGCSKLETCQSELKPMSAINSCYYLMFTNCTSLTVAPKLPATTIGTNCYYRMFEGCTNLITPPPSLPALTIPAGAANGGSYYQMFYGCSKMTSAPTLHATTFGNYAYMRMFYGCSSLTTAPELPAVSTLKTGCYYAMFRGCSKITNVATLPATTATDSCYREMYYGCTSLTTVSELPATTMAQNCYRSMFQGCTKITTAPDLPATEITTFSYYQMFKGCSKLNYVKAMFLATSGDGVNQWTFEWLSGVASGGTFVKNSAATWTTTGVSGVPNGWTVQTITYP